MGAGKLKVKREGKRREEEAGERFAMVADVKGGRKEKRREN